MHLICIQNALIHVHMLSELNHGLERGHLQPQQEVQLTVIYLCPIAHHHSLQCNWIFSKTTPIYHTWHAAHKPKIQHDFNPKPTRYLQTDECTSPYHLQSAYSPIQT